MAVTDQQKLDFLLKKIGYTKTKTGSVVGTGAISGTPKQPFAEAIPSPLIIANGALWNEADSIPTTPPGADTNQVKVYLAATSGLRMTADATSSGQRAYIAYSTYGNTSSTRLTNWIDTQFGASYIIKVYKGDPNSGGVNLSAAGSGQNDGWFFDYSAGVLNFNDTNVPSGVTDTNIYIVGYRYIGQTGAPTSGISTFSYLDLTVERNLDVGVQGGISTFRNNIDANGIIEGIAGENKIPSLYANYSNLPNAGSYHGMFAHVHATGRGYFAHAGNWLELVNADTTGRVGTGTESYFIDRLVSTSTTATSLNVSGIATFNEAKFANSKRLKFGDDTDLQIYHFPAGSGTNYISAANNTGIVVSSQNVSLMNQNHSSYYFKGEASGSIVYHNNTARVTTTSTGIDVNGDASFSGNVSIGGTLTYEDVTNVDSVGLLTARSGIRVTGGVIEAQAGENKIPSLYANMAALPSASTYHGMFAHVHSTGRGYFAHGGAWYELVNADLTGRVGTGTESYFIDRLVSTSTTATSLNVTGVTTAVTVDINGDLDVDGHTNLDNINIVGVTTTTDNIHIGTRTHTANSSTALKNIHMGSEFWNGTAGDYRALKLIVYGSSGSANQYGLGVSNGTLELQSNGHISFFAGGVSGTTKTRRFHITSGGDYLFDSGTLYVQDKIGHYNDTNTNIRFPSNDTISFETAGTQRLNIASNGNISVTNDLDVDGHTNLDNVSIAGVTTFAGNIDANGDLDVDGHTNLDNLSVAGVSTFAGNINGKDITLTDTTPSITFYDSNANSDYRIIADNGVLSFADITNNANRINIFSNGNVKVLGNLDALDGLDVTGNTTVSGDLDVDGHTELDNVNIVGVTTAGGHVLPSADITYDLGSSSKQWRNLYADNIVSAPGNGFIGPDLTVRNFKATGISTFGGNARFNSTIAVHDGTTGSNGQYLKSVGTGVTWASFPTLRTRDTIVASAGQTSFTFNYTVNFIDVFVNGIKLTDSEFTATNGTSVVLAVGCFVGDIVEFVSYNTVSAGGGGGGGTLNNIVEDTSPQLGGNLDLFLKTINGTGGINITGVVTATTFIGDGSGLTGITASGTGVVIRNNDTTVGTAGTINFGDDLSVTPIVAGIVTVGIDTSQINLNKLNVSGISTFNGNIDINADLDVDGHTNLDNVSIAGVTTSSGGFVGDITGAATRLTLTNQSGDSSCNVLFAQSATGNQLPHTNSNLTFNATTGALGATSFVASGDLDVDGHTELDNVNIAGVVTATTFKGALEATSGSFSSNIDANGDLDVDGHTNLDNLSVAGVSTFGGQINGTVLNLSSNITASGSISAVGANLDNQIIINGTQPKILFVDSNANPDYELRADGGVFQIIDSTAPATRFKIVGNDAVVGTGITLNGGDGHATYTGIVTALKFVGDGSSLTNVSAAGINTTNVRSDTLVVGENTTGVSTFHRVNIPTNKSMFFGNTNQASISYPTSGYMYLYGGIEGDMVIQTGGNRAIKMEASGNFEIDTGSNEIAIKATKNGPVELYQNGNGTPEGLRFTTTGVGVTVIGITSMTDNLMVGTAATITPAGAAQFAGIVTASSFIGDGSGLTGITASGSGIIVKDNGSTVGTAGTINFANGLDVTPISAGIVTVSTATTSITDGNSKLFVNNVSSSNGNGSFEVFLNEFTYGGTRRALNMHQPSDGYARIDLFHGAQPTTVEVNSKTVYSGYARHRLKFETNNASYGGQLDFLPSTGTWNFYSTYQGTQKNLMNLNYNSINVQGNEFYPMSSNATDLGLSSYKWRQFHVTGVNAGVVTATTYHGDGSNLTGISGSQNVFQTIAVSGQSNVVADSTTDTLTLVAGSNMTITTNASSDTITFASSGGSGGVTVQDEGSALSTTGTTLNFVGDNVVATGNGATKTITMTPADTDVQVTFDIAGGSGSGYTFTGPGNDGSTGNPDIYLVRGQRYRFINTTGTNHPFAFRNGANDAAYTDGITGSQSGTQDFNVQYDTPAHLMYRCTIHQNSMKGNIYIIGEPGRGTTSAATGSIAQAAYADITIPTTGKTFALLKIAISAPAWVVLYTDTTSRTSDAAGTGSGRSEGTDPTPGSGVLAEVSTTTSGASTFKMTPGVIGWNDDGTPAKQIYARVYNKRATSGSNAITVTLTTVNIEA